MMMSFYYSFTDWNGYDSNASFVGLENYTRLFQDSSAVHSVTVTLIFVVLSVLIINILAVLLAVILKNASALTGFYRSVIFLPLVISPVAVAFIWRSMYSYDGLFNYILNTLQITSEHIGWLTDSKLALISVIIVNIWRSTGFHMVIILAALMTIPKELYEASDIDGCNVWKKFKFVTLPLLVPGLTVSVILSTINSLKQYDLVAVLTDGGPVNATQVLTVKIIQDAFRYDQSGYASALSFILLFSILAVTIIQHTILKKKEVEY